MTAKLKTLLQADSWPMTAQGKVQTIGQLIQRMALPKIKQNPENSSDSSLSMIRPLDPLKVILWTNHVMMPIAKIHSTAISAFHLTPL